MDRLLDREFRLFKIIGADFDLTIGDDTTEDNSDYLYILTDADIEDILRTVPRSELIDYLEENEYRYQIFFPESIDIVRAESED